MQQNPLIGPTAVDHRVLAQRFGDCRDEVGGVRQVHTPALKLALVRGAMLHHRAHVRLKDGRDMRRDLELALDHVLRDAAANLAQGHNLAGSPDGRWRFMLMISGGLCRMRSRWRTCRWLTADR